ncbi:MAG: YCF48-related protein, partial [Bacteroidia bacterium]|nr:YCF48-related protein [Bacteroidia bacterium]
TQPLLSVHFVNAAIGWAVGLGGTILKTTNGGTTWTPQTSGTTQLLYSVHFVNAAIGWAVGNSGTILKTTDGGTTWTPQTSGTIQTLYSVHFVSETTGWVVGSGSLILKSNFDTIGIIDALTIIPEEITITNTIAEQPLLKTTVPAHTLKRQRALRGIIYIENYSKNITSVGTFRFKFGGTTLITLTAGTGQLNSLNGIIEFYISSITSTSQRVTARIDLSQQGIGTNLAQFRQKTSVTSSINTNIDQILEVSYEPSDSNDLLTRGSTHVEILRA